MDLRDYSKLRNRFLESVRFMRELSLDLEYRKLKASPDKELMRHFRSGHDDALAVIVDRYCGLVWLVAARMLHDTREAEELVKAVFQKVFQEPELFDENTGSVRNWLFQLAISHTVKRFHYLHSNPFHS